MVSRGRTANHLYVAVGGDGDPHRILHDRHSGAHRHRHPAAGPEPHQPARVRHHRPRAARAGSRSCRQRPRPGTRPIARAGPRPGTGRAWARTACPLGQLSNSPGRGGVVVVAEFAVITFRPQEVADPRGPLGRLVSAASALRSTARTDPTGKLTPARRCSAARVCALSRVTVRIPPPSPPTLTLTSVPVRCDRLSARPTDPSAPPVKRAGDDRQIRSDRPARPTTARRSAPRQAKRARAVVAPAAGLLERFAARPTMVASTPPSRATADRMFARTLPATFRCRHQGNCRISSQSWLATSASVSGPAGARRATAIAPGSNAQATTHAAGRQSLPEGEPIWTNACSTSSAASMPTSINQSRSPSTAGADASRGSCSTQSCHSCRASANPCARSATPSCSTTLNAPAPSARFAEGRRATSPEPCPQDRSVGVRPGCNDITPAKPRTPESRGRRDRHGLSPCLSGV